MKAFILTLFLVLGSLYNYAQTPWQVNVDSLRMFPSGGFIENYDYGLTLTAYDWNFSGVKRYLIKTDSRGKEMYKRFFKYEYPVGNKNGIASVGNLIATKDGGILACGNLSDDGDTSASAFVSKLNPCGEVAWSYVFDDKTFGGPNKWDFIISAAELSNGNLLLLGQFSDNFIALTISQTGTILNQFTIEKSSDSWNANIYRTANGEYLIAGSKDTHPKNDSTAYTVRSLLLRIDSLGDLICYNTYGHAEDYASVAFSLASYEESTNNIYMYGIGNKASSFGSIYLKKCDQVGNELWHKNLAQKPQGKVQYFEEPNEIFKLKDKNMLLLEDATFAKYYALSFARMIKVDTNGNVIDSVTLGDSANFYKITNGIQTHDSNIVVLYCYYNTSYTKGYIHLRKFDYNLKQLQMDTINYIYDSLCPHAVRTDDIDLSNSKWITFIQDSNKIYKTPNYCNAITAISAIVDRPQIQIWPNPFGNWIKVNVIQNKDINTAELYDIAGKLMWSGRMSANGLIETGQLTSGIYILSLYNSNGDKWNAKVVKE